MIITPNTSYDVFLIEKYKKELELLKVIDENTTLGELAKLLDMDIEIIIGGNCSGVDVINLGEETIYELTW